VHVRRPASRNVRTPLLHCNRRRRLRHIMILAQPSARRPDSRLQLIRVRVHDAHVIIERDLASLFCSQHQKVSLSAATGALCSNSRMTRRVTTLAYHVDTCEPPSLVGPRHTACCHDHRHHHDTCSQRQRCHHPIRNVTRMCQVFLNCHTSTTTDSHQRIFNQIVSVVASRALLHVRCMRVRSLLQRCARKAATRG
jgi:hypothetical protein